jgi:hypothetical protein
VRLLWEQEVVGSNPIAPISTIPKGYKTFNSQPAVFLLVKCTKKKTGHNNPVQYFILEDTQKLNSNLAAAQPDTKGQAKNQSEWRKENKPPDYGP